MFFKYRFFLFLLIFVLGKAVSQDISVHEPEGLLTVPNSSIEHKQDIGLRMHTNLVTFSPNKTLQNGLPYGETPASIACVYGLTKLIPGCPIDGTHELPTGGWGAIALVDAYYNPHAENDLNVFSAQFGLPACTTANQCFHQIFASGTQPPYDRGWADEQVLDIEWAHAMAPKAKIYLVEAASESNADLFAAVLVASYWVKQAGGGVVSNSWGSSEYPNETQWDSYFTTPGIVYVASSGDYSAPARYPSSSPFVISAGGASIIRDANGNFIGETGWNTRARVSRSGKSGGSGGPSLYEPRPSYQSVVQKMVGNARGTPDIAFDANPKTGVLVYSTVHGGWLVDGGTSVSAPAFAGVINAAHHQANSTFDELTYIYQNSIKNYHGYWRDILYGYNGFICLAGYDFVTGLGSPAGYQGK